jgi:phosphoheptose isomerase
LLTYWIALNNYNKVEEVYFRQLTAGYKLGDSVIAILDDLAQGGKEIE